MVKFGKNKLKTLNKLVRKQNVTTSNSSNKVLKKKQNAEKRVTFQKEVLLKEAVESDRLVKKISKTEVLLNNLVKESDNDKAQTSENEPQKAKKLKPIAKQKKRQQTQISDTKLLLGLMKKKS